MYPVQQKLTQDCKSTNISIKLKRENFVSRQQASLGYVVLLPINHLLGLSLFSFLSPLRCVSSWQDRTRLLGDGKEICFPVLHTLSPSVSDAANISWELPKSLFARRNAHPKQGLRREGMSFLTQIHQHKFICRLIFWTSPASVPGLGTNCRNVGFWLPHLFTILETILNCLQRWLHFFLGNSSWSSPLPF